MKRGAIIGMRRLARSVLVAQMGAFFLFAAGCKAPAPAPTNRATQVMAAVAGRDGDLIITDPDTIVNAYAPLASNAPATGTTVTVTSLALLSPTGFAPLAAGDLVLIIQMAGATIDTSDSPDYGTVSALNNAGRYEFAGVESVNAAQNQITLSCGLKNNYTATGKAQVVRVPQYSTLTIANGASIVAMPWDGTRGGIVALHASTTLNLAGEIDVSGQGFRGGATENASLAADSNNEIYRNSAGTYGAEKGEGIAGDGATYDTLEGRYGRGAPANGGGGGNSHNAGGGGGANGRSGLSWTGQGVMLSSVTGATAWSLDPGYITNGNTLTNSEGGGRGGYSYSNADLDGTVTGPGNTNWLGDNRREAGGLGGHPVDNDPASRLFMGGGGGAGDGNNLTAGKGGAGGGLVFILAGTVSGQGSILAQGEAGGNATGSPGDAPGGGGGGGTVVVRAAVLSAITIDARGGAGGTQTNSQGDEAEGPGGGGGGGYIAVTGGSPARLAPGGANGISTVLSMAEFPSNGATAGNAGQIDGSAMTFLYCGDQAAPDTTIATYPSNPTNQTAGTFTFTSDDPEATFECRLYTDPANRGAFAACPASFTTPTLAEGPHYIDVRARDLSGNVDPSPATYPWVVDTTPPNTSILNGPEATTISATGTFTFDSDDDDATFECSLDGATFAACTATFTTPALAPGEHTLTVRAKDAAGNVDPSPAGPHEWTTLEAPDGGMDDADNADAMEADAALPDAGAPDTADAMVKLDTATALDAATPDTPVQPPVDAPVVSIVDASQGDATDAEGDALVAADARTDARDTGAVVDTRPADAMVQTDTQAAVADARTPDTTVIVAPQPDAAVTLPPDAAADLPKIVAMGGGFCAVGATNGTSRASLPILLGVAGIALAIRRRRR